MNEENKEAHIASNKFMNEENKEARIASDKFMVTEHNLPLEVANDNFIKSYKILEGDKVVKYYERAPHPQDKPAVIEHGDIITKPVYLGEWRDQTDAYLKAQEEKRAQLQKDKKAGIVDRSGRARTQKEIKEEELRAAQRLLAELLLNNEEGGLSK